MSAGIDYGHGRTNIDHATGIRFGVISQHTIADAWFESAEPDYGNPTCPKCGNDARPYADISDDAESWESAKHECADYACAHCECVFGSESAFGDEPSGWNFNGDGYSLVDCLDSDVMVIKSPFYTFAAFCSPCVPGAGNLDSTCDDGVKTYCLGHEWHDNGVAPYPVYRVDNDARVFPDGVLSWRALATVPVGTRVTFATSHDIFPECIVPATERATVVNNALMSETESRVVTLLPDSESIRAALQEWNGEIVLYPELTPDQWDNESPLTVSDS